jgi:hypothetical protein
VDDSPQISVHNLANLDWVPRYRDAVCSCFVDNVLMVGWQRPAQLVVEDRKRDGSNRKWFLCLYFSRKPAHDTRSHIAVDRWPYESKKKTTAGNPVSPAIRPKRLCLPLKAGRMNHGLRSSTHRARIRVFLRQSFQCIWQAVTAIPIIVSYGNVSG